MERWFRRCLIPVLLYSVTQLYAQDRFVIEGDTIVLYDTDWEEIEIYAGKKPAVYSVEIKGVTAKSIPLYHQYYETGTIEYLQFGYFQSGGFVYEGPGRFFYESGVLLGKRFYKDGFLEGATTDYYDTGQLHKLTIYHKGKESGMSKTYYETGELQSDCAYENGQLAGVQRTYYKSGQLESKLNYVSGQPDGVEQFYFPDGSPWTKRHYQSGCLVSVEYIYAHNGAELPIGTFENGNGTLYIYDSTSRKVDEVEFVDGLEVGKE